MADRVVGAQVDLFVIDRFPEALDEHVAAPATLPSMLIAIPCRLSRPMKASLVSWLSWSLLKIVDVP